MRKSLPRFTSAIAGWLILVVAFGVGWKLFQDRRTGQGGGDANPLLQLVRPLLGDAGGSTESTDSGDAPRSTSPAVDPVDEPTLVSLLPDPDRTEVEGPPLLHEALRNLQQYRSLAARIRQRIDLFGQPLSGAGVYQQWGRGQDLRRVRLELKLQVGGQTASFQQICDGRFLWDRRDIPQQVGAPNQVVLSRLDLLKVRQALADSDGASVSPAALRHWTALGGLAQLLDGLDDHFDFPVARPARLGRLPVWVLAGRWRRESLERFFPKAIGPDGEPDEGRLPAHCPQQILLVLGADENIPLFPYRVEYQRRTDEKAAEQGGGAYATQAMLELFEVQVAAPLDPESFRYDPVNQEVIDSTQAFIRKLQEASTTADEERLVD